MVLMWLVSFKKLDWKFVRARGLRVGFPKCLIMRGLFLFCTLLLPGQSLLFFDIFSNFSDHTQTCRFAHHRSYDSKRVIMTFL